MKYDKKTIEERGVDYVKAHLRRLNTLDPNIVSNDKGISWDGHIFVYQSVPFTKKKLVAKIPTQVKTRTYAKYRKSYSIQIADLKNYKEEGSILYFWVQIVNDQPKIFYASLFLIDLEHIVNSNPTKKSVSIEFTPFPEDISAIRVLIDEYIKTAKKQKQVLPNIYDLETFSKQYPHRSISFEVRLPKCPTPKDIVRSIKEQKPYVYYQPDRGLSVPVGKFELTELCIMTENDVEIRAKDEILFTNITQEYFGDKVRLKIGKTILLDLEGDSYIFNYNIENADLVDTIKTLQFVIALMTDEPIYLNNKRMFAGIPTSGDIDINLIRQQLDLYLDIQKLFKKLGIRKSLFLQLLPKDDTNKLIKFCQSELYDHEVSLVGEVSEYGLVNIGDIHVLCCCKPAKKEGYYIIKSIFDHGMSIFALPDENGNPIPVSSYLLLSQGGIDGFRTVDNINYDDLIDSLNIDDIAPVVQDAYNSLFLSMLSYYDEVKDEKILSACLWLSNYLCNCCDNAINFINLCQVKHRNGNLTESDNEKLAKIKNNSDDNIIKLACSILLHSYEECQIYYSQLPKQHQDIFSKYPIKNLWVR